MFATSKNLKNFNSTGTKEKKTEPTERNLWKSCNLGTFQRIWIESRGSQRREGKKRNRIGLALEYINLKGKGFFFTWILKKIYMLFPITKEKFSPKLAYIRWGTAKCEPFNPVRLSRFIFSLYLCPSLCICSFCAFISLYCSTYALSLCSFHFWCLLLLLLPLLLLVVVVPDFVVIGVVGRVYSVYVLYNVWMKICFGTQWMEHVAS